MKPDLVIAGAGMAGLVAAVQAAQRGARVEVFEKGDRPGGSMLLSSGVVWRHRDFARFRAECPDGGEALQRLVHERLDDDLRWLTSLGARVTRPGTGNPATTGLRFDPVSLTSTLVAHAGRIRLGEPLQELPASPAVILATGGFAASRDLVREHITPYADDMLLRASRWSTGDGLALGLEAGAALSSGLEQLYGRAMPAPPARVDERSFVELSQLYARHAVVESATGERFACRTWSEIDVVQWLALQPGARGTFTVAVGDLDEPTHYGSVGTAIEAAVAAGAEVVRTPAAVSVRVVAGITTTLGGLRADPCAQVADSVFAAGADIGGIATGGYASGLAAALVLGRIAADSALGIG